MDYVFRQVISSDLESLLEIFNHYIETSYAAFYENKVDESFIINLKKMTVNYPFYVIETSLKQVVGFGLIHRYHPSTVFNSVAELTYFILPIHVHQGLGTKLLNILISDAKKMGIDTLLAVISSLNQKSIDFHTKNGFVECGRFMKVGRKFDQVFDLVWMQKFL